MSEEQKLRKWVGVGYTAKVVGLGTLALMGGARADTPLGTDLARRDGGGRDNATALHLDQKRLPHLSNQTDLERNLSKVTPELLDHLGKFVKNPEQFIQNARQLEQNFQQREQKREQRKNTRQLMEKAQNNPEVLESLRKLFEEIPGKESSETNHMKRDLGTERLTPEKIDPEIWRNVRKMLSEKTPISDQQNDVARRDLNDNTGTSIVLVHGITSNFWDLWPGGYNSSIGSDCNGYWGNAINYLQAQGYSDIRTIQYYTGDINCNVDLHASAYQSLCDNNKPGNEGTNNENLDHVSCLLAQYLNQNFAGGQNVILVGHSMGGIIIRNTVGLVGQIGGQAGLPNDIGYVTDAVTFNSPHAGVSDAASNPLVCGNCLQITQLTADNPFMIELGNYMQNPQTSAGFTQWTVVGSECDIIVGSSLNPDGAATAIAMQASHAIMYSNQDSATCYNHGGALGDSSTANDATLYYCDTSAPTGNTCRTDYNNAADPNWAETITGAHGLQTLYEAVGR
jgi:hypothetical protein